MMNGHGKSDSPVVAVKSPNKAEKSGAEGMEGKGLAKGNLRQQNAPRTRLLEFGPFAAENRRRRGQGRPGTFHFLGFTHIFGRKRSNGRFTVIRQTIRKRLQAKLSEVKAELKRRMHDPIPEVGKWLGSVVGGHIRYYGVPMNGPALTVFRFQVVWLWLRALSRCSQNGRVRLDRMRETRSSGSVEGVMGDHDSYSDFDNL